MYIFKVYGVVNIAPKFGMIKGNGGLINKKISWIIISFGLNFHCIIENN